MQDHSTHGVVALVQNSSGKFLLLEDGRELMRGYWAPPHGCCETSDISEEASVIREVQEETGLRVKPLRKVLTQAADTKIKTVSFWLVESDSESVQLDAESSEFGWFTVEEALRLRLYPGTRQFLECVRSNKIRLDKI